LTNSSSESLKREKGENEMPEILAIYGSPRRNGNTATLLREAVRGARSRGGAVEEVFLRDLNISPCLEIYGCKETGRCVIKDDFQELHDKLLHCRGLMLASPVFFYTVSAHTKTFMDRCQALWVKKYWIDKNVFGKSIPQRKGLFISAGATGGKRLFEGVLLTVKYFLDALDMELSRSLLYRGLDLEGDAAERPEYLKEAYMAGCAFYEDINEQTIQEGGKY
jgi:multimeric flavodoxin WrbA